MTSELVVDAQPKEISIALLEDKNLVEFQKEERNLSFSVGNMYVGKIRKLMPGLNACFVDVGFEKDAFLHYLDLGPQFNSYQKYLKQVISDRKKLYPMSKASILPDIDKDGTISNVLQQGQEVIVQIVKEPISTKGPRLTCELSFAGRYLVLIPFNDKVSVSQKIKSSEERARLKQLLQSIKPKNFGVIVRTVAEGKRVAELDAELKVLLKHWEDTISKVQKATKLPSLVYEETSRTVAMLRDLFNPSYENIYVNDESVYNEVKDYVTLIAPERSGIVKLYKGQLPIFDNFAITKQIKSSFGKTVSYKSGAYLIIEHTEALHVEDVEDEKLTVLINGQEAFKAGDINKFLTGFEVLNTELVICHMDPSVNFQMEITIQKGRGYVPSTENMPAEAEAGFIPIDAIYTPIRNVKYEIENYRVEGKTDYEKLLFEIETDGSIAPTDALKEAAKILIHHFMLFSDEKISLESEDKYGNEEFDEEVLHMRQLLKTKLVDMDLSVRALNCLKAAEVETLGELCRFNKNDLLKFRNFGKKSLTELEALLENNNLEFGMDVTKYKLDKE